MSDAFLSNFMRAAQQLTRAERCVAINNEKAILDSVNVSAEVLASERFSDLLKRTTEEAIATDDAVITNNLIQDADQAPQTNVHLHDLRMIVAIPVAEEGVIYLDQPIRQGVFERDMIAKLMDMARSLIDEDNTELDSDALVALYQDL